MPTRGSKHAPKLFRGQPLYTQEFLSEYEDLLVQNSVTTEKDKCELIRRYCNSYVKDLLETIYDSNNPDWTVLKAGIEKLFDSDLRNSRYKKKDLKVLVKEFKHKPLNSMS